MNNSKIDVNLTMLKMSIKLKNKLHEIGVVDWPIDLDLLTDTIESSGDILLEYIYDERVDVQDELVELVANNLAKKIENAGMQLPVFGAVLCRCFYMNTSRGERVGIDATYLYGGREKKLNDRRSKNLSN